MENELTHWGIKGMKWGVRRYQNKDGSLTPAGRKRYEGDSDEAETPKTPKKKSVKDMSDNELMTAINRARMEDAYRQLRPEPVPKGKKFIDAIKNDVAIPAITAAGKKQFENFLNKVGDTTLNKFFKENVDTNSKAYLTEMRDKLKLKKEIKELKEGKEEKLSWEEMLKKQQYERNEVKNKREDEEYVYDTNVKTFERAEKASKAAYNNLKNIDAYEELVKDRATRSSGRTYTDTYTTTDYRDVTNSSNVSAGQEYANALIRLFED